MRGAALAGARMRRAALQPIRRAAGVPRRPMDVLFLAVMGVLIATHVVIFVATLVLAPETAPEAESLALVHLPLVVARLLTAPFIALLLVCLYRIGAQIAGRWGGMAPVFAIFALNLRADTHDIVYGPSLATGGFAGSALFALAMVLLPRRRYAAAVAIGAAAVASGLAVLLLPGFLVALAIFPPPSGFTARDRVKDVLRFVGAWAVPFVLGQLLWLSSLGVHGWLTRFDEYLRIFRPHRLLPAADQALLLFSIWHFPWPLLIALASTLFIVAGIGIARFFVVPRPGERRSAAPGRTVPWWRVVLRRFPIEFWAAAASVAFYSVEWGLSGATNVIEPNLPAIVVVIPLVTTMAYKGAKFLYTVSPGWRFWSVVYLVGLFAARTVQLLFTVVESFQR